MVDGEDEPAEPVERIGPPVTPPAAATPDAPEEPRLPEARRAEKEETSRAE